MSEPLRALVTGGAGYFGSLLCSRLRQHGYRTRIFDIHLPDDAEPDEEVFQGDISDPAAIARACQDVDVVFHNVAQVPLAKDKELFWKVNRDGTRNMLDACVARNVKKVIYTSTSAIYGIPESNPVTEQTEPHPMEEYGRAKLAGEVLCRDAAKRGLDVSIIRPRTIMGHGRLGIFQILFEWIYQGKNIPVLDGGKNIYQFVHADDLAEACILASKAAGPQAYNCGATDFGSMRDVLENLCRYAGTGSRVKSLPMWAVIPGMKACSSLGISPLAAYHSLMYGRSMYFDVRKACTELGWKPRYSNDAMFRDSYDWYLKNRITVLNSRTTSSHHKSAIKQGALTILHRFF
jgi:nucleoside-diphosphate-sugar epimerase